jgi:aryl carrier-like protein
MMHQYRPEIIQSVSVPIGSPIDNVQIYLLDQYLQPVPIGITGEIYISGDGVAEGYLNQPELTAERFLDNPFLPGNRMYRSGDLAVMLDDGTIEYRGRFDSQVKIKGHRIELGEIEQALLQHISVQETVVVDWKDGHGTYQLIAYVVLANDIQEIELRSFLEIMLPNYMIPSFFVRVVQLPLTNNGKLDLQALPDPTEGNLLTNSVQVQSINERTLQTVCEIMEDILQINHVEPTSNFFHLGGDSVKAIQIVARLKEKGLKLQIKDVLNYPIVGEMAAILVKQNEKNVSIAPIKGKLRPTPIMRWFFNQQFQNPHHWNQSVVLSMKKSVNAEHINEMLSAIVRHHDILRLQYDEEQKILYHHDGMLTNGVEAKVYNFSNESFQYATNQIREFGDKLKASINLNEGPLFKAALFQLPNDRQWLLLTAHHLVVDAVSWLIMIEDANRCLEKLMQGEIPEFPEKTSSFQAWSEALYKSGVEQVRDEILYWKSINLHRDNTLYLDEENASNTEKSCVTLSFTLDKEKTMKLLTVANTPYKTQPIELLLAALVNSLGDWTSQDYIKLELEGHGREELFDYLDISRTVGWFTTLYPAVFQVLSGMSDQIILVKEELRKIPNKGIGYGLLQKELSVLEESTPSTIRFNYLGEIANQLDRKSLTIETIDTGADKFISPSTTAITT